MIFPKKCDASYVRFVSLEDAVGIRLIFFAFPNILSLGYHEMTVFLIKFCKICEFPNHK